MVLYCAADWFLTECRRSAFLNTVKIACGNSCRSNTGGAVGSRGAASIVERDNELTEIRVWEIGIGN